MTLKTTKTCNSCKQTKAIIHFSRSKRNRDGLQVRCKDCNKKDSYRWKDKNPERFKSLQKDAYRRRVYGISSDIYEEILKHQNNCCRLCKHPFDKSVHKLKPVIDHDHKTGKFRGVIHHRCNLAIGQFEDNLDLLKAAWLYLQPNVPIDKQENLLLAKLKRDRELAGT